MHRYILLFCPLLLAGCFSSDVADPTAPEAVWQTHTFTFAQIPWQLNVPSTWEILPTSDGALFMARNGDANIAILPRDQKVSDPAAQIIQSARQQFFTFTLDSQDDSRWRFTGQLSTTAPPRVFWQQVMPVPTTNQFLLGSCSQHQTGAQESSCPSILTSWKTVKTEGS